MARAMSFRARITGQADFWLGTIGIVVGFIPRLGGRLE
jgi:hypothetical protein